MTSSRLVRLASLVALLWMGGPARADAQLGSLISPGRLSRPHAALEGLGNCQKCHEQGKQVVADRCLSCHKPIADRIARKVGVHKSAANDCVSCHVEHAGVDGELRPFDQKNLDHARMTGFVLDGRHAGAIVTCASCHKGRSFLTANASCASCHADVHKGSLGKNCASCHSAKASFKALGGQFDHTKAAFQLVGAHRAVACTSCHVAGTFKGVKFASCTDCHKDPHRQNFGATCTSCHSNDTWRTKKVDHTKTTFQLVGRHTTTECVACHKQPAMRVKPRADTCAACHVDVHRGSFKQDCKSCHSETGFGKTPFDHTKTRFALTGKHVEVACASCHTSTANGGRSAVVARAAARPPAGARPTAANAVDFRGLRTECVSCHRDVHGAELGSACESCHSTSAFKIANYVHPRFPDFFGGSHARVACDKCHRQQPPARPVRTVTVALTKTGFKGVSTECASCHEDVHLGQEGVRCESCHTVQAPKFAQTSFTHKNALFQLTGRHETAPCSACHRPETATFPARSGTAVRYKGLGATCVTCHADVHLGQVAASCESCHATSSFKLLRYKHRSLQLVASGFFSGRHAGAGCQACHRTTTTDFPGGRGTAIQFKVDARCVTCHTDVHRGSLGSSCIDCHRI
jgi:hypothetical protein